MKTCPTCQLPNEDAADWCPRCRSNLAAVPRGSRRASTARSVAAGAAGTAALAVLVALSVGAALLGAPLVLVGVVNLAGWIAIWLLVAWVRDPEAPFAGANLGWSALIYFLFSNGVIAGLGAIVAFVFLASAMSKASCPHVYSSDGERLALDADPLSGAFLRGAERDDLVRLDRLRPVGDRYRLEIRDELPETDVLDAVALVVVDHDPVLDVLPTEAGAILGVRAAARPVEARDRAGDDRLAALLAPDDGAFFASTDAAASPDEALEIRFARPAPGAPLALALRAHATPFAEEALVRYLATMGPGLAPLLAAAEDGDEPCDYPFRDRIADETRRLGLPMEVELADGEGAPFRAVTRLDPVGPAIQRTQAVPLPALDPRATGAVRVRLRFTRRFWAVDEARLGESVPLAPTATLASATATGPRGDVVADLAARDGRRVTLAQGERIALELPAPPPAPPGVARTVLFRARGYYEADLGRAPWINPTALVGHQLGWFSLPKLAERLAAARPDLVATTVR
jgi:hypothetical protein